ncbi:nucleotidyl transferase AbiEii/AbiGii toxin family protein [Psychroflexus maritimus]|uniref:Nucleotidyl transferase AbiEii/AbiGii toxin family protein n=1 Tax=Psychroflexus maritimus TaxID=2714865 RepID=A0A967AEW8_9FLAO|nr:nucleotidyl transferase AbiEii/AbiGii toxin family protein [Psychroflexus maritimus]NGZ90293.1 nucleotidyl transferase AbiEii/AbiGii toxin family protein [Psychroflexus maritimus]
MSPQNYKAQVGLLLAVLPEVAKEDCFALHGGTAINLFSRNMPRLSVDIDLTYLPLENRNDALQGISKALLQIKKNIEEAFTLFKVQHLENEAKLLVSSKDATIKIEVNLIKRGCYAPPQQFALCEKAQDDFEVYTQIAIVEQGHLFGGKICAALDRQHPRDLFDIKYMLEKEGFSPEIKKGFLFYLISSNRPIVEVLFPVFKDQSLAFSNQFEGMSQAKFDYSEYEKTREVLVRTVNLALTKEDKTFLASIEEGEPDWSRYDFSQFPAVQWKLQNINLLKKKNPAKHKRLYKKLKMEFSKFENNKDLN